MKIDLYDFCPDNCPKARIRYNMNINGLWCENYKLCEFIFELKGNKKEGYWLFNGKEPYITYKCSKCGDIYDEPYDFCPACGAQMELKGD